MYDIEQITERAWRLLCRLCDIPRVSRDEAAATNLLECAMRSLALNPHRHLHNLWAVKEGYDPARPTLMLNAHIDTVPPSPSGATREGGAEAAVLRARGANDDGASLVALLHVFAALRPQSYNLVFVASAEEEVSGRGGIESVLPLLPRIDVALVGEPTSMRPAIAEKGLMVIDAVAHGKAGHAARNEGDNAIMRAMDDIARLNNIEWRESPLLGKVKTTVTIIHAGTVHNTVPDRCEFTIDTRTNELYSNQEVLDILRAHLHSDLTPRSTRLGSSHIDRQHPLVRRALALGLTPFGSPTLSDQALLRCPSLKIGPGDSSRSHTAGEYILKEELREGISLYMQILDGLAL